MLLIVACVRWVHLSELVWGATDHTQVRPPQAAAVTLILLALLSVIFRRMAPKTVLTRGELLCIFIALTIAIPMASFGLMTQFFTHLIAPERRIPQHQGMAQIQKMLPPVWLPTGPDAHRAVKEFYEGSKTGVPLGAWVRPLLWWGVLFSFLYMCMLGMGGFMRRHWIRTERLTFPIARLALSLSENTEQSTSFWRSKLTWAGFGLVLVINLLAIVPSFIPGVEPHSLWTRFNLGAVFTKPPLDVLSKGSFYLWVRPIMIGLAYLIPRRIQMSILVFYFGSQVFRVGASYYGMANHKGQVTYWWASDLPFQAEQTIGAFVIIIAASLLAQCRNYRATKQGGGEDKSPVAPEDVRVEKRFAVLFVVGFVGLIAWCTAAGVSLWVSLGVFTMLLIVALGYARIRAQVGPSNVWLNPFRPNDMIVNAAGSAHFASTSLVHVAALNILARSHLHLGTAAIFEAFKMGDEARIRTRDVVTFLVIGFAVGLPVVMLSRLDVYYNYGGAVSLRHWKYGSGFDSYKSAWLYITNPTRTDWARLAAYPIGALVTLVLFVVSARFPALPLHPIGFALAGTEHMGQFWGPVFIALVCKSFVIHVFGAHAYRKSVNFFLGIAFGHFLISGLWGFICGSFDIRGVVLTCT